jgi:hypothetical protein
MSLMMIEVLLYALFAMVAGVFVMFYLLEV